MDVRLKVGAVAALAALMMSGCESPPESGYVYDKEREPGYYTTSYTCGAYDKSMNCTFQIPMQTWHPPTWALCLQADNPDKDGKRKRGCREVSEATYNRYDIGQHYPNPA